MGKLGHEFESSEMSLRMKMRPMAPAIGVIVFLVFFFGIVFGIVRIYDGDAMLGAALCAIAIAAPIVLFISMRNAPRG